MTLSSACCCHSRSAASGVASCAAGVSSFTLSTRMLVSSSLLADVFRLSPEASLRLEGDHILGSGGEVAFSL